MRVESSRVKKLCFFTISSAEKSLKFFLTHVRLCSSLVVYIYPSQVCISSYATSLSAESMLLLALSAESLSPLP